MPIKRRTSAARPPGRPSETAHQASFAISPLLSAEEKHQLILAHVAQRKPPPEPAKRLGMWAGVIVCVCLIVTAWFFTVGHRIKKLMAAPLDPGLIQAATEFKKIGEKSPPPAENSLVGAINSANEKAMVQEAKRVEIMQILQKNLSATSTLRK